jgi:hypothetical protein
MYTLPSGCVTLLCTVNIAVGPSVWLTTAEDHQKAYWMVDADAVYGVQCER